MTSPALNRPGDVLRKLDWYATVLGKIGSAEQADDLKSIRDFVAQMIDAFAPIPEAKDAPTDELWAAYNAFNDRYCGFNTQQALRDAINTVLANRSALAAIGSAK